MYCPNCGAFNYDNAKFCIECGAHLHEYRGSAEDDMNYSKSVKPKARALQIFLTILIVILVAGSALVVCFAYLLDIYTYSTCDIDVQSIYAFLFEKTPEYKEAESELTSLLAGDYVVASHETYFIIDPEAEAVYTTTGNDTNEILEDAYVKFQNAGDFFYMQIDYLFPSLFEIGEVNVKYTFRKASLLERLDCLFVATKYVIENGLER